MIKEHRREKMLKDIVPCGYPLAGLGLQGVSVDAERARERVRRLTNEMLKQIEAGFGTANPQRGPHLSFQ